MAELKNKVINIDNIKSPFIIKDIFSLLNENKKLNIIIYNKKLQNLLEVDIERYKNISGRFIEGEKNGKGKEYELKTNILLFEGEYLKWKRNGKGKEYYYNGKLLYEGEYLNGKEMEKEKNIIIIVNYYLKENM